ncbi:hypothetical protein KJ611_01820 [Patescibacteria group bacterium]|nr:hypothetical protein [Patescibacteria group bacterium]MBU1705932.1 hypothetical protein [Patescibacteria group bacterium]
MILGKINQPDRGLFALVSAPAEQPGVPGQIIKIILDQLGPNLDQALLNLTARPEVDAQQYLNDAFQAAAEQVTSLFRSYHQSRDLSVVMAKANHLGGEKFRVLLTNLGDHQVYFQEPDRSLFRIPDQAPDIITATLTPGHRLILTTRSIREHLTESELAKLISRMPHSDATAEHLVLRHLEPREGDKGILIWTAKSFTPQGLERIPETERGIPVSVRLARLNDQLQGVVEQLSKPHPALERLRLEMAKANLEYWLAFTLREAIAAKLPPILSAGDLVHLPESAADENVIYAFNPADHSYLIRQSRRRGHRHDHHVQDLAVDRFTLESWQTPRLTDQQAALLARAMQALNQMKSSHQDYQQKKRTHDLFLRQSQDLQWENRRRAMRQKVSDIY